MAPPLQAAEPFFPLSPLRAAGRPGFVKGSFPLTAGVPGAAQAPGLAPLNPFDPSVTVLAAKAMFIGAFVEIPTRSLDCGMLSNNKGY